LKWVRHSVEEYEHNARYNLGRNQVEDMDGEMVTILDPDVEG
jgi:hypothetical protein